MNLCAGDVDRADKCQNFLDICLTHEPQNEDECVGGALLICTEQNI